MSIQFIKSDTDRVVKFELCEDSTWWELTDHFIDFMKGCGYHVTFHEVADYLNEGREWSSDE